MGNLVQQGVLIGIGKGGVQQVEQALGHVVRRPPGAQRASTPRSTAATRSASLPAATPARKSDDLRIIRHHDLMGDDAQSSEMESQDMLSKLTQAQLIINQCDELIAKQALRIDELERVLRKLVG